MDNKLDKITEMVNSLVTGSSLFLVDAYIKPTNNIKIFLDGDEGVTIDAVTKLNRALYKQLEEEALYPDGDFSLEVSSAGLDAPLKFLRQYTKNIGRKVSVITADESVHTGILMQASEAAVVLEETLGKKKEKKMTEIPFEQIKSTTVQISF